MVQMNRIPPEARRLAALETRLEAGDLTNGEMREIQETLLLNATDKTKKIAQPLFERVERKKTAMQQQQASASQEILDLSQKIAQLNIRWDALAPLDQAEELTSLNRRAVLLSGEQELPGWVRDIGGAAQKQLERLNFEFAFPGIRELNAETLEPTFASRLKAVAEQIQRQNALDAFQQLNPVQQREVIRYTTSYTTGGEA